MTMRRGIRFKPELIASEPTQGLPPEVCGIPVIYHPDSKHTLADARGLGRKAHIAVGPGWHRLDPLQQQATLYHEAGHIIGRHREFRVVMAALLLIPSLVLLPWNIIGAIVATTTIYFVVERWAQNQEIDADRFAARKGFGAAMLHLVRMVGPPASVPFFYPDYERRCGALTRFLEEQRHGLGD